MTGHVWMIVLETLEWIAVIAGVAEVLLARTGNIWLYPAGILSTVLTVFVLFEQQLFGESALNVYYAVMSAYGWWYWTAKRGRPAVQPSYCNAREWGITGAIVCLLLPLLWYVLKYHTTSPVPLWDAWVSATAWAGMWLLARRKIENWILLNISNAFAIPLLFYKHLPLFAYLTIFLFLVAIQGYYEWRKEIRSEMPIE